MTTRNEALAALAPVAETYNVSEKHHSLLLDRLVDILTTDKYDNHPHKSAANEFMKCLWINFSGGGTADAVTREVFDLLGRGAECPAPSQR